MVVSKASAERASAEALLRQHFLQGDHCVMVTVHRLPKDRRGTVVFRVHQHVRRALDDSAARQALLRMLESAGGGGTRRCRDKDPRWGLVACGDEGRPISRPGSGTLCCAYHFSRRLAEDGYVSAGACAELAYGLLRGYFVECHFSQRLSAVVGASLSFA